jgi:UDP-2,4-diacetamido-2,4,6-trideoxy-beta-L-altropyranose hydrolase
MNVAFRTDASIQIGTGHVMRCLALADELHKLGANSIFICRKAQGHLCNLINQRGHTVLFLPQLSEVYIGGVGPEHAAWLGVHWEVDAQQTQKLLLGRNVEWLVVDHYALDRFWEGALRNYCKNIMVIDDLADRPHDCDILLDQNLGRKSLDYRGLVSQATVTLIGPIYALIRPEFSKLRAYSLARRAQHQIKQLLISLGGVDKDNITEHVLSILQGCNLPASMQITVVMGSHAPWREQVLQKTMQMQVTTRMLVGVGNMAQLMADSDLAIGAGGSTAWERCCLGLPTLLVLLAANQLAGSRAIEMHGAGIIMKTPEQIKDFFQDNGFGKKLGSRLKSISKASASITDGMGANQVAMIMRKIA